MKRIWLAVSVAIFVLFIVAATLPLSMAPSPHAGSPDGKVSISSTCFQGSKPHPLDGTLRLIVFTNGFVTRKIQTSIPYSRGLSIKWIEEPPSHFFVVKKRNRLMMKFLVDENGPRCIEGMGFLADDPYETAAASPGS